MPQRIETMQHIFKTTRPVKWMMPFFVATVLLAACGSTETKTDDPSTDTASMKTAPANTMVAPLDTMAKATDSMPPIDKSATTRPEGVQTVNQ